MNKIYEQRKKNDKTERYEFLFYIYLLYTWCKTKTQRLLKILYYEGREKKKQIKEKLI